MPRRRRRRRVGFRPNRKYFGPGRGRASDEVVMRVEELEAIRLKDGEGFSQVESAEKMDVSQPTFSRILESARQKVADALVNGKALRIEGGDYEVV